MKRQSERNKQKNTTTRFLVEHELIYGDSFELFVLLRFCLIVSGDVRFQ